jgi:hypothetical protein|tara:strand:- start:113 stop:982 length:870 start_codon:yes stop_codon:yes gene_type:complete
MAIGCEGFDVEQKNDIRTELFQMLKKNNRKPFKQALLMPADTVLCVKEGLKIGVFDKNTRIYAIERDYWTARIIETKLKDLGFKEFYVDTCEMSKTYLMYDICGYWDKEDKFHDELKDKSWDEYKFDMVYLDTCGNLSKKTMNWIAGVLSKRITKNCQLCFTFQNADRTNAYKYKYYEVPQHYISSTITDTQKNANQLICALMDCLEETGHKYYVEYSRTYQNDNLYGSKSKRSPMITCYLKRKSISLKKPKQFSGSMDTLDLGYRENIRYKKRIWGWMELPCDMEINW